VSGEVRKAVTETRRVSGSPYGVQPHQPLPGRRPRPPLDDAIARRAAALAEVEELVQRELNRSRTDITREVAMTRVLATVRGRALYQQYSDASMDVALVLSGH
jgi:hypothetical protein